MKLKLRSKKTLLIILICALCVFIGLGVWAFLNKDSKNALLNGLERDFKELGNIGTNVLVKASGSALDAYDISKEFASEGSFTTSNFKASGLSNIKGTTYMNGLEYSDFYTEGYTSLEQNTVYSYVTANSIRENYSNALKFNPEVYQQELIEALKQDGKKLPDTQMIGSFDCFVVEGTLSPNVVASSFSSLFGDYTLLLGKDTVFSVDPINVKLYFDKKDKKLVREIFDMTSYGDEYVNYLKSLNLTRKTVTCDSFTITIGINKYQPATKFTIPNYIIDSQEEITLQSEVSTTPETTTGEDWEHPEDFGDEYRRMFEEGTTEVEETEVQQTAPEYSSLRFYDEDSKQSLTTGTCTAYFEPNGQSQYTDVADSNVLFTESNLGGYDLDKVYYMYYLIDQKFDESEFTEMANEIMDEYKYDVSPEFLDPTKCKLSDYTTKGITGFCAQDSFEYDGIRSVNTIIYIPLPNTSASLVYLLRHEYDGEAVGDYYDPNTENAQDYYDLFDPNTIAANFIDTLVVYNNDNPVYPQEQINLVNEQIETESEL